ncbi:MAG: alpha/beta family hydrolase [Gemmatimonadota bacterium]
MIQADRTEVGVEIEVPGVGPVSGLLRRPARAAHLLVFGHGAGAGMRHRFMEAASASLAERGVATMRYNFPYMEAGRRAPDRTPKLVATVRAAVEAARDLADGLPVFAGGKSMGGRMTSTAAAETALPGVAGLVFFGFPLHGVGKPPSADRGIHLADVGLPILFLQGTRDRLADLDFLRPLLHEISPAPVLHVVDGADHGFHMLKRSGRTDEDVVEELAATAAAWMAST